MAKIETEILSKAASKPIVWERYIDYVFSLWDMSKPDKATSIEQANLHHPTIKFTAEISATDTIVYKGKRCKDQKTHVNQRRPSNIRISPLGTHQAIKDEAL